MARRMDDEHPAPRRRSPAKTPEELEAILVSKSQKLIERQIDDGSISSTVLAIYAKAGTERDRLEKQELEHKVEVLKKKVQSMEAAIDVKNLMEDALQAFRGYSGDPDPEQDDGYYGAE